jgi:hypothetical protein
MRKVVVRFIASLVKIDKALPPVLRKFSGMKWSVEEGFLLSSSGIYLIAVCIGHNHDAFAALSAEAATTGSEFKMRRA